MHAEHGGTFGGSGNEIVAAWESRAPYPVVRRQVLTKSKADYGPIVSHSSGFDSFTWATKHASMVDVSLTGDAQRRPPRPQSALPRRDHPPPEPREPDRQTQRMEDPEHPDDAPRRTNSRRLNQMTITLAHTNFPSPGVSRSPGRGSIRVGCACHGPSSPRGMTWTLSSRV